MLLCTYDWLSNNFRAEYGSTRQGCQSCSWSGTQKIDIFPCPRSGVRIWSRETGSAVLPPANLLILISALRLNLVFTHGIAPVFRGSVHLFIPPTAIGSVSSLSCHAIAYRWCSLPRARRHSASSPQRGSCHGCPFQVSPWTN